MLICIYHPYSDEKKYLKKVKSEIVNKNFWVGTIFSGSIGRERRNKQLFNFGLKVRFVTRTTLGD